MRIGLDIASLAYTRSCKDCRFTQTKTVNPKGTRITRLTKENGKLRVTWKKQTVQTAGYQIQYAADVKFKSKKDVFVKGKKKTTAVLKKIKKAKKTVQRISSDRSRVRDTAL